ncbi:MAG: T9SS type A sorting domain-containing protein [Ignavibacteriae bacterium]|nr:T9SS type A sorting domain-containing protein [Ignavibacteriota bacterium]
MKKYLLFISIFLCSVFSFAQWQPDVRLTFAPNDSFVSLNNSRCIAAGQNYVHIVWADDRDGNREIYYKRSTDYGTSWGPDINLSNNPAISYRPCISMLGSLIHVVWCDNRDGNFEIYYKRSTDNGVTWQQEINLTNTSDASWAPSLAINGANMHVVWEETLGGNEEIFYKNSTDNGLTWGPNTRLTNDPFTSLYPSVAVSGSFIHVAWYDYRPGNRSIFYKRSTDGGANWGQDIQLSYSSGESYNPGIAVSGQTVHISYQDTRFYNEEIFYIRSSNGGTNWGPETRLTNTSGVSWYPSIAVSGNNVHLAWYDTTVGNYEIYYGLSTDGGLNWLPNTRLTYDTARSYRPSIMVSGAFVHLIWNDARDGNLEVYYKRNPTGNPIGIKNIYSEIPKEFSLQQNYPNPFNLSTIINYQCSIKGNIKIKIYDITGKEVVVLVNGEYPPGMYEAKWDANGQESGLYLYSLFVDNRIVETKKMLLIK